jgi:hypothetical protein
MEKKSPSGYLSLGDFLWCNFLQADFFWIT